DGGVQDVVLGDILARKIYSYLVEMVGEQATTVLAGFALGGDIGLPIDTISKKLGMSLPEVKNIVTKAASGLILETQQGLAVYPSKLRHVLVRDTFFGLAHLPILPFIENAPPFLLYGIAETLIGAKTSGAEIPWDFFLDILQRSDSAELWKQFASLGREE